MDEKLPEILDEKQTKARFWEKVHKYGKRFSFELLEKALYLYYVLGKPNLPSWARATVIGALGYLIWPLDTIPDVMPFVGFSDDLAMVVAALGTIAMYVDDDVKKRAQHTMREWIDSSSRGNDDVPYEKS